MLELLTCKRSVATPGLYYVLQAARWNLMTTIFNDRFKTEKDFGTKFCYTLDRALQICFDRATRWSNMAIDGEPDYLRRKAVNLIERIEDGRALNIMLPAVLLSSSPATPSPTSKKRDSEPTAKPTSNEDQGKKPKRGIKAKATVHNGDPVTAWAIPSGHSYSTTFGPKMPRRFSTTTASPDSANPGGRRCASASSQLESAHPRAT